MAKKIKERPPKSIEKLRERNSLDGVLNIQPPETAPPAEISRSVDVENPALLRLRAFKKIQDRPTNRSAAPVNPAMANWVPMGPLAIPGGQTYGGARVLVSGRVTAVVAHPSNANTLYLGTARGGVWKTIDGGVNWTPKSDHEASLAIGALALAPSNPNTLYAGTGEGNLQFYSTTYPLSSAPGVYLGIGVLKSTNGGNTWVLQAPALFANKAFYRLVVHRTNPNIVFAATSAGLCRTSNGGTTWTAITGGGLPAISASVIACTDVLIDLTDVTGNTVFAAFWGAGIYKSTNALAATPAWTLVSGLPAGSTIGRISLAQSASNPTLRFALLSDSSDAFAGVYRSSNVAGTTWALIISSTVVNLYGAFTNNIAVDPTTPNVLYLSGVELYRAVFSGAAWAVTNIGSNIHPDSHAFAFSPTSASTIYSGNDGGIYKSINGGSTWDDSINEGLALLQYEALDHSSFSDAVLLGGTQDNGTEHYRNSPVFYHSNDGDGGYNAISPVNANHHLASYYSLTFRRSILAGRFGSWSPVNAGLAGAGLFYPPLAMSPTSNRTAVGTDRVNIDDNMGTLGWPTKVTLPGITASEKVSALHFATNTLIYAATTAGKVYKVEQIGLVWSATALHATPLPTNRWIWDVASTPGNPNEIRVAFSGFGLAQHVWRGTVPAVGVATWSANSNGLPDVPMYALAMESASTYYVGTDIGVYRTTNSGTSWNYFNQGMPNTAIYDLRFHTPTSLLRAATHGRGLWEIKTNVVPSPPSDLYFRDNIMHTGRSNSGPALTAGFEDLTRQVLLGNTLNWWECADIKVDAPQPLYQMPVSAVDYLAFEVKLFHRNPDIGNVNRVYVQVNNRGTNPATNVQVKIMVAGASAGLPNLPSDFWSSFPNSPGNANWTPVGSPLTIPVLEPLRPTVLEWDWTPPIAADTHSCMLVVMDSASDPIPAVNKVFDIATLVTREKRAGLKNLHLVNLVSPFFGMPFHFYENSQALQRLRFTRVSMKNFTCTVVFDKAVTEAILSTKEFNGFEVVEIPEQGIKQLREQFAQSDALEYLEKLDLNRGFLFDPIRNRSEFSSLLINEKGLHSLLVFERTEFQRPTGKLIVSQYQHDLEKVARGGSTIIVQV